MNDDIYKYVVYFLAAFEIYGSSNVKVKHIIINCFQHTAQESDCHDEKESLTSTCQRVIKQGKVIQPHCTSLQLLLCFLGKNMSRRRVSASKACCIFHFFVIPLFLPPGAGGDMGGR